MLTHEHILSATIVIALSTVIIIEAVRNVIRAGPLAVRSLLATVSRRASFPSMSIWKLN